MTEAAGGAGGQGSTGTGEAGGAGGQPKPWYDGIDAELIGHWDNKGWKKDDAKNIVIEATRQARELQKHFGVPETQLLKLPKPDDAEGWKGVHQRLGAPKEAKEYDFSAVKMADGSDLDAAFVEGMRNALFNANVSKDKASAIVKAVVDHVARVDAAEGEGAAAKRAEGITQLRKDWGSNFEFNRLSAMQGARRLGLSAEGVAALEGQAGYANVMEALRKIGVGTTEDTFVDAGRTGHPSTVNGAKARLEELQRDTAWAKRLIDGNAEANREFQNLMLLIHGEAA